jgi:hypothetical protein
VIITSTPEELPTYPDWAATWAIEWTSGRRRGPSSASSCPAKKRDKTSRTETWNVWRRFLANLPGTDVMII